MNDKPIDQQKLLEFMKDGWSYRSDPVGTYVPAGGSVELADKSTGEQYTLYVDKGELSMKEVAKS